jgi:hypothetical protein
VEDDEDDLAAVPAVSGFLAAGLSAFPLDEPESLEVSEDDELDSLDDLSAETVDVEFFRLSVR